MSAFQQVPEFIEDIEGLREELDANANEIAAHEADATNPHLTTAAQTGAVALSQVGTVTPPLVGGKVPSQYLPDSATVTRLIVNSQAEMLASGLQPGDAVLRTDDGNHTWQLWGNDPTILSSWNRQTTTEDAPVQSVNNQVGTVLITDGNLSTLDVTNSNAVSTLRTTLSNLYASLVLAFSLCADRTLSNLTNYATARSNLGLGNSATRNVGTIANTVAAGDDPRFGYYSQYVVANGVLNDVQATIVFSDYAWATRLQLFCLGPGCGGGRGATGATATNRLGGGGGAGGALSIAEYFIPDLVATGADRIVIVAGRGGIGDPGTSVATSAASNGGTVGNASYAELRNGATVIARICLARYGSGSVQASGIWFGAAAIAGTSGITTPNSLTIAGAMQAGAPGTPGGGISNTNAVGTAGAAGMQGMFAYRSDAPNTPIGSSSPAPWLPWFAGNGGWGGGARDTANAISGGDGGNGSGGGGGGAALNGFTSGSGGNGGPGTARAVLYN